MKETRDSIADIWGERTPYVGDWSVRVDERISEEPDQWVQSACLLCSNGCGMDIGVKEGRIVGVRGRAVDAVNHGRLGPKGLHGWVANHSQDRLTHPLIRRNGQLVRASWDEAMDLIVQRSKELYEAAPDAFVQISPEDAAKYGIEEGDLIQVKSRRGRVVAPARVGDIEPGLVFIPFHYGYWDNPGHPRAANELTIMEWDPVSKQPHYKYAAVSISKTEATLLEDMMDDTKEEVIDTVKDILNLQEV